MKSYQISFLSSVLASSILGALVDIGKARIRCKGILDLQRVTVVDSPIQLLRLVIGAISIFLFSCLLGLIQNFS